MRQILKAPTEVGQVDAIHGLRTCRPVAKGNGFLVLDVLFSAIHEMQFGSDGPFGARWGFSYGFDDLLVEPEISAMSFTS